MEACPLERTKRSRLGQMGSAGSKRRNFCQSVYATGASAIGVPGWPELACCTASMASVRMVLMQSWSRFAAFFKCDCSATWGSVRELAILNYAFHFQGSASSCCALASSSRDPALAIAHLISLPLIGCSVGETGYILRGSIQKSQQTCSEISSASADKGRESISPQRALG